MKPTTDTTKNINCTTKTHANSNPLFLMMNMAKTVRIKDAEVFFPNYEEYPSISVTGCLLCMKKLYGWNTKFVVRIGGYYYNLSGHPYRDKISEL